MSSAKTSTALGLIRHPTTLRLTRIATLVAGSLVFLYACEVSRKNDLSDVWGQVAFAAVLALTGLTTAWFEIKAADHAATRARTDIRGFLIESDAISVRARITRSGDLVFHGHDSSGTHPAYEWDWAFRATTFPAIRAALGGGRGDLLNLLEHAVPELDPRDRYDPGAWLHNQGIVAAFRERGETSDRITRELPVVDPETLQRDHPTASSRESTGAHQLSSKRRNTPDPVDPPRPSRSSRRDPSPDLDPPPPTRRRAAASQRSQDPRNSAERSDEPSTRRRDQPSNTRRRTNDRWEAQSQAHAGIRPSDGWDAPAGDRWDTPPSSQWDNHQSPQHGTTPSNHWNTSLNDHRGDASSDQWNTPPSDQWDDPPARRIRRSRASRYESSADDRVEPSSARRSAAPTQHHGQPPYEPHIPTHSHHGAGVDSRQSEPSSEGWDEPSPSRGIPNRRRSESHRDEPTQGRRGNSADPRRSEPSSDRWEEPPATRYGEQQNYRQPTGMLREESSGAHRHLLSGTHPGEPHQPNRGEQQAQRRNEQSGRRHRKS